MSDSLQPHEFQHARPPCPSPTPGVQPKLISIKSVMPSSHLILCRPLLLLPPIPPSIRVFSNESTLCTEKAMATHSSTLAWKIPWMEESDTTERLHFHFHFSLSCIGEGHGNPLQCSCLKSPRDRGAWWVAVYGVAQSWTRLK